MTSRILCITILTHLELLPPEDCFAPELPDMNFYKKPAGNPSEHWVVGRHFYAWF